MDNVWQDIRYSFRQMKRNWAFTLLSLLLLGLGIGANTSIFSLVNMVLLRPLPVDKASELFFIEGKIENSATDIIAFSYPNYLDFRDRNDVFNGLVVYRYTPMSLSNQNNNSLIWGFLVSGNYFDVLGVKALYGRTFLPEEDKTFGTHPVVVLSYRCWNNRFGGDPNLVGKKITLNNYAFTVIGITPEGFNGTEVAYATEFWVPTSMAKQVEPANDWIEDRNSGNLLMVGRLKPGISQKQAEDGLSRIYSKLMEEYPKVNHPQTFALSSPGLFIPSIRSSVVSFAGFLMVVVTLVLFIACTNLANLLLARATERRREIATRLALGATRARLIQQLLTESLLLSFMGGILGLLLAFWLTDLATLFKPAMSLPFLIELKIDYRVLIFTLFVSIFTGVLFGLIPAIQATKSDLIVSLKDNTSIGAYSRSWLQAVLIVSQVSLSLILLISSGLVIRSLQQAQKINPGFNPDNLITLSFDLGLQGYNVDKSKQFFTTLTEQLKTSPGIKSIAMATYLPLSIERNSREFYIEGNNTFGNEAVLSAMYSRVSAGYFKTMEIPIVEGREFTWQDNENNPEVAIINETLAKRYWPRESAIGKRLSYNSANGPFNIEIVGIAKDGKYLSLSDMGRPFIYCPLQQSDSTSVSLIVRTDLGASTAIAMTQYEIKKIDGNLPVFNIGTLREHLGFSLLPARIAGILLGCFGILALSIASVGLYGVIFYSVVQRTREIGIRVSLGAKKLDVLKLIVGRGLLLASIGVTIGTAIAFVLSHLMADFLYGVSSTDPITFLIIPSLLMTVALIASYLPAVKATKIDPLVALKRD